MIYDFKFPFLMYKRLKLMKKAYFSCRNCEIEVNTDLYEVSDLI